jgi:hypothetical protein
MLTENTIVDEELTLPSSLVQYPIFCNPGDVSIV